MRLVEKMISDDDAKEVRNDFQSISIPVFKKAFSDIHERELRKLEKLNKARVKHNSIYNKISDGSALWTILGSFLSIFGILSGIVVSLISIGYVIYMAVADTDRKLKLKLTDLFEFKRRSPDKITTRYRNGWNTALEKEVFLSLLYTLALFRKIWPGLYRLCLDSYEVLVRKYAGRSRVPKKRAIGYLYRYLRREKDLF